MGKRRVLVIDDEVSVTRLLKLTLERGGDYEVWIENTGRGGLDAVGHFDPDVILLDVIMPDMTGHEVLSEIQADPRRRHIPVVFLTATAHADEAPSNPNGHPWISKPARVAEVIDHIERALAVKKPRSSTP